MPVECLLWDFGDTLCDELSLWRVAPEWMEIYHSFDEGLGAAWSLGRLDTRGFVTEVARRIPRSEEEICAHLTRGLARRLSRAVRALPHQPRYQNEVMFPQRQSGFEIVKTSWFAHEAHLAQSLLESEGIDAWVLDASQVGVQWHVAGALGGIKVGVREEDAERARAILAEDYSDSLAAIEEVALPASAEERCPRCGSSATKSSRTTERPDAWSWASMSFFFLLGLLVPRKRRLVRNGCTRCGQFWSARS